MYKTHDIISKPLTNLNIVLDLDETLLHTHDEIDHLKELGILNDINIRQRLYCLHFEDDDTKMWGITRMNLKPFLEFCFSYFKRVIVWTAGCESYAEKIVAHIFKDLKKPDLVWSKNDCQHVKGKAKHKPLKKLMDTEKWLELTEANTLFLDDRDHTFAKNPRNAIQIPEYTFVTSEEDDITIDDVSKELIFADDTVFDKIVDFLLANQKCTDVRLLDKSKIF